MEKTIVMPAFDEKVRSAILCAWLKEPEERVEKGEAYCEVEVNKVVSQLEAEEDFEILELLAEEGDEVPVGDGIARVQTV